MARISSPLAAVCLLAAGTAGPLVLQQIEVAFVPSEDTVITGSPGLSLADQEVAGSDLGGFYQAQLTALTDALPAAASIDALDFVSSGEVYFSLSADGLLDGASFADEDVIWWDGASFSVIWDGSAQGLPAGADLDALDVGTVFPLQLFFRSTCR